MPIDDQVTVKGTTYTITEQNITLSGGEASLRVSADVPDPITGVVRNKPYTFTQQDIVDAGQGAQAVTVQNSLTDLIEAVAQAKFGA